MLKSSQKQIKFKTKRLRKVKKRKSLARMGRNRKILRTREVSMKMSKTGQMPHSQWQQMKISTFGWLITTYAKQWKLIHRKRPNLRNYKRKEKARSRKSQRRASKKRKKWIMKILRISLWLAESQSRPTNWQIMANSVSLLQSLQTAKQFSVEGEMTTWDATTKSNLQFGNNSTH